MAPIFALGFSSCSKKEKTVFDRLKHAETIRDSVTKDFSKSFAEINKPFDEPPSMTSYMGELTEAKHLRFRIYKLSNSKRPELAPWVFQMIKKYDLESMHISYFEFLDESPGLLTGMGSVHYHKDGTSEKTSGGSPRDTFRKPTIDGKPVIKP